MKKKQTPRTGGQAASWHQIDFWKLTTYGILALCILFIVYPFIRLFIQSFFDKNQQFTLRFYQTFFQKKYYWGALLNSLKVCVVSTFFAILIGVPLAFIRTRYQIYLKRVIDMMVVLSLMSPPFIGAYSWILLLGKQGFITKTLQDIGIRIQSIYGFQGIILVFTLKLLPYVYMYVNGALQSIDYSLEEAAESMGTHGIKKLMHITFPLILPTILSSALIVFMAALADYGTPYLIGQGYRVFPVTIYDEYMSEVGGNVGFASALSVIIILCAVLILLVQKRIVDRKSYRMSALKPPPVHKLPTGKKILATVPVFLVALLCVLPQMTVIFTSFLRTKGPLFSEGFSLDSYRQVLHKLGGNIRNTFTFAAIALVMMMILGLLVAYIIVRRKGVAADFLDMIIMSPYVIPGSVLGISLLSAFNTGILKLTATPLIMITAYVIRKLPYTLRSGIGILYQLDQSVEEASISLGVPPIRTFFKTTARMMLTGLLSGAVLSFISTINELSSSLILYSAKTSTISVAIFSEIIRDSYGPAAALSTILTAVTILSLVIFNRVSKGKSVVQ